MVDDESNDEIPKKLKGLAANLKHILSLPTMEEVTSEEEVEQGISQYQDFATVDVGVDFLEWWQRQQEHYPVLFTVFLFSNYLATYINLAVKNIRNVFFTKK